MNEDNAHRKMLKDPNAINSPDVLRDTTPLAVQLINMAISE